MSAGTARDKSSIGTEFIRFNWNVCVSIGKADILLTLKEVDNG